MGTNAKIMAEQARIPLDFTYGVIDKCILKALTGKNSLIMTSGGMVDHSMPRIRALAKSQEPYRGGKLESCESRSQKADIWPKLPLSRITGVTNTEATREGPAKNIDLSTKGLSPLTRPLLISEVSLSRGYDP